MGAKEQYGVVSKADSLHDAGNPRLLGLDEPQGAAGYCVQSGGTVSGTRALTGSAGVVQARS